MLLARCFTSAFSFFYLNDDSLHTCFPLTSLLVVTHHRYHKSSGSLLHRTERRGCRVAKPADMSAAHGGGAIRLFAPEELLRVFGFPGWYRFPPRMKLRHRFKLIGQSINVKVVECVMRSLFWEDNGGGVLSEEAASGGGAQQPTLRAPMPPPPPPALKGKKGQKGRKKGAGSRPAGPAEAAARAVLLAALLAAGAHLLFRGLHK